MRMTIGCVAILLGLAAPAHAQGDPRLTLSDVTTTAQRSDVNQGYDTVYGADGKVASMNFYDGAGTLLLGVTFGDANYYASSKKYSFSAAVTGLGDEAFDGPPPVPALGRPAYALWVKRGNQAFGLNTSALGMRPAHLLLSMDQLKALAKIILSRE
jgi:hypothetical protein